LAASVFAQDIVLENQTSYPNKDQKTKMAIQWAASAKEVDGSNKELMYNSKITSNTLLDIAKSGKLKLSLPEKAEYFRVIAWSKADGEPDYVTNWVDIVPNKVYLLKSNHLVPVVLMLGTGC
jgi:hypothetical protein